MRCYNCNSETDLKEWKFPKRLIACKTCSEYFRKCMVCRYDVDLNVIGYEIISEDKILCEQVVCADCMKDGNVPKDYYERNKLSDDQRAIKFENKVKQLRRDGKVFTKPRNKRK